MLHELRKTSEYSLGEKVPKKTLVISCKNVVLHVLLVTDDGDVYDRNGIF